MLHGRTPLYFISHVCNTQSRHGVNLMRFRQNEYYRYHYRHRSYFANHSFIGGQHIGFGTLFMISFNTQENQIGKLRHAEQINGRQMRKSYSVLFDYKVQTLKQQVVLHLDTTMVQARILWNQLIPPWGSSLWDTSNRKYW